MDQFRPTPERDEQAIARERAASAYAAMVHQLHRTDAPLFAGDDDTPYAHLWPYSQALAATIDLALLARDPRLGLEIADRLDGLAHYWQPQPQPAAFSSAVQPPLWRGGDRYYDDNHWIALELLRLHETGLHADGSTLARARQLFLFAAAGWDTDRRHAAPGGVFWVEAAWNRDRGTVCTAPAAQVAVRLFRTTGDRGYLTWAERLYGWTRHVLAAPEGLYWDRLDLDGRVERTFWSYNQGTMLGAGAMLAGATGDHAYLEQARQTADASLEYYAAERRLWAQPMAFNAIYLRNLLRLAAEDGGDEALSGRVARLFRPYADGVWESSRDADTGLFHLPEHGRDGLLNQAAVVQLYALLADPRLP